MVLPFLPNCTLLLCSYRLVFENIHSYSDVQTNLVANVPNVWWLLLLLLTLTLTSPLSQWNQRF